MEEFLELLLNTEHQLIFKRLLGVTFLGQTQRSQSTWKTYDKSKGHYFSFWAMRSVTSE